MKGPKNKAKTKTSKPSPPWAVCCSCGLEKSIVEFQFSEKNPLTPKDRAWWKLVTSQPVPRRYRCVPPPSPCPKLKAQKLLARASHTKVAVAGDSQPKAPAAQLSQVIETQPVATDDSAESGQEKTANPVAHGPETSAAPSAHTAAVCRVVFSRDGGTVYSASKDKTVCEWDPLTAQVRRTIRHEVPSVADVALSSATGSAAWALIGNRVEVRNEENAPSVYVPGKHGAGSWISAVAYSYDNKYLAYGSDDKFLRVLDVEADEIKWEGKRHEGYVSCIAFAPDGSRVASGSVDMSIQIWDMETGYGVGTLVARGGCPRAAAFSPDTSVLAAGCGSTLCLWNLRKLKVSMRCRKHKDSINALAFSPSGQLVASGSADRTIILWNAVSGQILRQIDAHSGQVLSLSFAPDGKMIASGSEDCMVKMWPVEGCEGGGVAEEHGAAAPVEQQPPRVRKVSSLHVLSKSDSGLYVSLATDESVVRRCSQCLGYTDGRNTSERCLCWG